MISWAWLIPAFVAGFYLCAFIQLFDELRRDEQEITRMYEDTYYEQEIDPEGLKRNLEQHKN